MDHEWMRSRLVQFKEACEQYMRTVPAGGYIGDPSAREAMYRLEPTARQILRALDPELSGFRTEVSGGPRHAVRNSVRGIGIIDDAADVAQHLRPQAPVLSADGFHPWVWDAAATFWDAGVHAVAVEQAAKSLIARTRQKTGSQLSDDDLMTQAWSDDPPKPDRPRLRMPGDRQTDTWKSRQRGARALAQGCYAGIRNVVAHDHEPDWTEQVALEYLAAFSVLARWIDEAEVERSAED